MMVYDSGYTTYYFAVPISYKRLCVRKLKSWILLWIVSVSDIDVKVWDIFMTSFIKFVRELYEVIHYPFRVCCFDDYIAHNKF